ncbi:MAG: hypothetical protein ACRC8S_22975 [Fimbriiglobus sp.]
MGQLAGNRTRYVAVWRVLLRDWLAWPEERFAEWVAMFDDDLNDRGNSLFYHYDELHFVVPQLVPRELAESLQWEPSATSYNALGELLGELGWAITGRPFLPNWGTEQFDWHAARERVEAVLQRRGASLG